MDSVIKHLPPSDGRDWDCQCARCGSSCEFVDCYECDDGFIDMDYGDDVISDIVAEICPTCRGRGGWQHCMSSEQYCQANPIEGREHIERGKIEWYTFDTSEPTND